MIRHYRKFIRMLGRRGVLRGSSAQQRSKTPHDRVGGWILLVVGLLVVSFSARQALVKEQSYYEDGRRIRPARLDHDPYYEKVTELVNRGLIDLSILGKSSRDPIKQTVEQFTTLLPYGIDEEQLLTGPNRLFYKRSPLRSDIIKLLQGNEQSTFSWNMSRDRIQIDRNRRKIGTPFYKGHSWTGKLLYRKDDPYTDDPDLPIVDSDYELRVIFDGEEQMSQKLRLATGYPQRNDWGYAEFGDPIPGQNAYKAYRFSGRPRQPGDTAPNILEVFLTKDESSQQLLLNLLIPGGASYFSLSKSDGWVETAGPAGTLIHTIALGGDLKPKLKLRKSANPGESPKPMSFRVLTPAEAAEDPYYWQNTVASREAFSFSHYHNGIARRVRINNSLPHSLEFLKSLDDSIAQIYLEKERDGIEISITLKKQDFLLTIDPTLQSKLERVVHTSQGGSYLEIAATIMSETGEVLAAADAVFPGTKRADFLATRPRYRLNRNFWEHPVGSSGKPYLYAAGIHANPELKKFVLPRMNSYMGSILGYGLPKSGIPTLHTSGVFPGWGQRRYDFATQADEAFARSSNAFFMGHLLSALASKENSELPVSETRWASFQVGSNVYRNAPDLSRFLRSEKNVLSGMIDSPFVQSLNSVFDIKVGLGDGPFSHANVDESYGELIDFFADLSVDKDELVPFLAGSAPEHSRLIFSDNMRIGHDLLYIAIGGANFGRWSNLDIARCMTRLVTGKAVNTTLLRVPEASGVAPPLDWPALALDDENQKWMRERLQAPGRGTAAHLRRNVPGNYRLFAKTGTFRINIPNAKRGNYNMITFYIEPKLTPDGKPNETGEGGLCAVVSVNSPTSTFHAGLWKRVIDSGLVSNMVRYIEDK